MTRLGIYTSFHLMDAEQVLLLRSVKIYPLLQLLGTINCVVVVVVTTGLIVNRIIFDEYKICLKFYILFI
jgi:hypothetical protein